MATEVACPLCGTSTAVPEAVLARGEGRCPTCGAKLSVRPASDAGRDQLDTIPLHSGSLHRLATSSVLDEDVDSLLDTGPARAHPRAARAPLATAPFELTERAASAGQRAPQPSVAFELTREEPVPLTREEPVPLGRAPQPSVAFELTRPAEDESRTPEEPSPGRSGAGFVIFVFLVLVVLATLAFGRF